MFLVTVTVYSYHIQYKGILSDDKPAICRRWSSARCQAQGGTPRRNASL